MHFNIPEDETDIAVGLSGGGDSMALTHMLCTWASHHNKTIHILTINHQLRSDMAVEIDTIQKWVCEFPNAIHHILSWDHDKKPDSAIMEKAREARYQMMVDYCQNHQIKTLCIAHHADDQLETFLFRLSKGSGLDGLTSMKNWTSFDKVRLYRPLLDRSHNDLISYCEAHQLQWVEDPSNGDDQYARPRLRKALANEGLDPHRFCKTIDRLARAQEALDWMRDRWLDEYSLPVAPGKEHSATIDWNQLKKVPLDIQIRILQKVISENGHTTHSYPPKLERIEEIIATIKPSQSATLHGCLITLSKDAKTLEVLRA